MSRLKFRQYPRSAADKPDAMLWYNSTAEALGGAMARKKVIHWFLQVCHYFAHGKFWASGKFSMMLD